jgi:hypothetical protein
VLARPERVATREHSRLHQWYLASPPANSPPDHHRQQAGSHRCRTRKRACPPRARQGKGCFSGLAPQGALNFEVQQEEERLRRHRERRSGGKERREQQATEPTGGLIYTSISRIIVVLRSSYRGAAAPENYCRILTLTGRHIAEGQKRGRWLKACRSAVRATLNSEFSWSYNSELWIQEDRVKFQLAMRCGKRRLVTAGGCAITVLE